MGIVLSMPSILGAEIKDLSGSVAATKIKLFNKLCQVIEKTDILTSGLYSFNCGRITAVESVHKQVPLTSATSTTSATDP